MHSGQTTAIALACGWMTFGAATGIGAQGVSLPIVQRSGVAAKTPFDIPPLIVIAHVRDRRTTEERDTENHSFAPPKLHEEYRMSIEDVLRVNERLPSDPDLVDRFDFVLRQTPGARLSLDFAKEYILLIKYAKLRGLLPWPKSEAPPYVIALPDGGFEIGRNTVRVLRPGGKLAAYDGRPVDEVIRVIRAK
jgi:hypothetical protein